MEQEGREGGVEKKRRENQFKMAPGIGNPLFGPYAMATYSGGGRKAYVHWMPSPVGSRYISGLHVCRPRVPCPRGEDAGAKRHMACV